MAPESGYHSSLALTCEPAAVPAARRHAMNTLAGWGIPDDSAYDALTIVTELATNAVSHASTWAAPSESEKGRRSVTSRCPLELWTVPRGLCISVWDESNQAPVLRLPSDSAESGRGLHVVAELCRNAWGFAYPDDRPGKIVWARLPLPLPHPLRRSTAEYRPGNDPARYPRRPRSAPRTKLTRALLGRRRGRSALRGRATATTRRPLPGPTRYWRCRRRTATWPTCRSTTPTSTPSKRSSQSRSSASSKAGGSASWHLGCSERCAASHRVYLRAPASSPSCSRSWTTYATTTMCLPTWPA
ncbi:hypothetical protein RVR_10519 [Actinacidiphila reveromycinica]|uniref:Histidine kinase/HSP90-like ATPase domain-containing protein n=1 Tax=Actinacidiphila reveromycinica TaxID=659352 RepID=A0A7U3UUN5_9ACTN|nr:hypothetical protein RVR_10519 [Streptomyces sp. SN-593]